MLIAVIRRGARLLLDRHNHFGFDRLDRQRTVCRLRNDILSCSVYSALSSVREDSVIRSGIRSLRANCDRAEISAIRRTGKAGNAMLVSIISHRVAVRFQLDVLIIVEIDLVRSRPNRNRLIFIRFRRNCAAVNRGGGCLHLCPERLLVKGLGIRNLSGRPVPVVVHRIAQVGLLLIIDIERVINLLQFERPLRLSDNLVIAFKRFKRFGRCMIDQSTRIGCSRFHVILYYFFTIIIDITDFITSLDLCDIDISVQVPSPSSPHIIICTS